MMHFDDIFTNVPEVISKEQFCKICHVSKRLAKYWLDHDLLPGHNTGKATHSYLIQKSDMIEFLNKRQAHPELYCMPAPKSKTHHNRPSVIYTNDFMNRYKLLLLSELNDFPDLLTTRMVIGITGYCETTVNRWKNDNRIKCLHYHKGMYIPKESLLRFMMSDYYLHMPQKSQKHIRMLEGLITE